MAAPLAVFQSLRNREFLVASTSTLLLILRLVIILSTGLITLSLTPVTTYNYPVTLQTAFTNNSANLVSIGTLPAYTIYALANESLQYPAGLSENYAYQIFGSNLTDEAIIQTTVDAFSSGLDCEPADLVNLQYGDGLSLSADVRSKSCNNYTTTIFQAGEDPLPPYWAQAAPVICNSASNQTSLRIAVLFVMIQPHAGTIPYHSSSKNGTFFNGTFSQSAQMFCTPTYNITRVEVARNATDVQNLTLSINAPNRTLDGIEPWDIATVQFQSVDQAANSAKLQFSNTLMVTGQVVSVDAQWNLALSHQSTLPSSVNILFQYDYLKSYFETYFRKFAAVVAHESLIVTTAMPSTSDVTTIENRLVVRALSVQLMVPLITLAALLVVVAIIKSPKQGFIARGPNTIFGIATLAAQSYHIRQILHQFSHMSATPVTNAIRASEYKRGSKTYRELLDYSKRFSLASGKHSTRTSTALNHFVLVVGIVVSLEILLHLSEKYSGVGTIGNNTYLHYSWTVVPSILLGLLAVYFGSADFATRGLAPYQALEDGASLDRSINLNLLDGSVPSTLYKELRAGHGSLFLAISVPQTSSSQLFATESFSNTVNITPDPASSLVLESNLSYLAFSYQDLAFPVFALSTNFTIKEALDLSRESSWLLNATVPALRSRMDCKVYNSSQIETSFVENQNLFGSASSKDFLKFSIDGEPCSFPSIGGNMYIQTGPPTPEDGFFGAGPELETNNFDKGHTMSCSEFIYVWGHYNRQSSPNITSVSAMACNTSVESVDVAVNFIGVSLAISETQPPVPIEPTARNSTFDSVSPGLAFGWSVNITSPSNALDKFFSILTTSRWAVPISMLGEPGETKSVAKAIKFQWGLIVANFLVSNCRVPAATTNATLGPNPPVDLTDGNDARSYPVTVTDPIGVRRMIQDATSTRILEALLLGILVLAAISWVLAPNAALLPRSPTSIANTIALLRGGNMLACLPTDPTALGGDKDALRSHYRELGVEGFRMGWVSTDAEGEEGTGSETENKAQADYNTKSGRRRFSIDNEEIEGDSEENRPGMRLMIYAVFSEQDIVPDRTDC
ncbi:hypothetical protein F5Y16DRAFT_424255 [Xylariaceae sp. FL0255]|nr:hypothetical protein F5Y16DRAFT_424255 [Xylariaceae sp. FL0255]